MGRAERRKFFRKHPYCMICEKMHKRVPSTMIVTSGIAVCDQCAANIAAFYQKQKELLEKENSEALHVGEATEDKG